MDKGKLTKKLFEDHPEGQQLRVGKFRGEGVWYSDDDGKTWWSGWVFSHSVKVTRAELINMAISILRDMPEEEQTETESEVSDGQ